MPIFTCVASAVKSPELFRLTWFPLCRGVTKMASVTPRSEDGDTHTCSSFSTLTELNTATTLEHTSQSDLENILKQTVPVALDSALF